MPASKNIRLLSYSRIRSSAWNILFGKNAMEIKTELFIEDGVQSMEYNIYSNQSSMAGYIQGTL